MATSEEWGNAIQDTYGHLEDGVTNLGHLLQVLWGDFVDLRWWVQAPIVLILYSYWKKVFPPGAPRAAVRAQTDTRLVQRLGDQNSQTAFNSTVRARALFSSAMFITLAGVALWTYLHPQ